MALLLTMSSLTNCSRQVIKVVPSAVCSQTDSLTTLSTATYRALLLAPAYWKAQYEACQKK